MTVPGDGFERMAALADGAEPVDAAFAARLRRRVERALGAPAVRITSSSRVAVLTTAIPVKTISERTTTMTQVITPYLCARDAAAAIDWYRTYFGADISGIVEWEGKIGHAELDVSGAVFYLSDEVPQLGVVAPDGASTSVSIVLQVAAVEEFVARAAQGGAVLQRPIEESHGSRHAWLLDPFGHRWNVGTPVYTAEQIAARRAPSEPYYMTLTSPDVERAAAFFGVVLGWEFAAPNNGGRHVVNTDMPIVLRPPENPFSTTEPGQIDMWFTVRDFDDAVKRAQAAGGTVVSLTAYDSGREAICTDDQGVTFKLSEPAPGHDR